MSVSDDNMVHEQTQKVVNLHVDDENGIFILLYAKVSVCFVKHTKDISGSESCKKSN